MKMFLKACRQISFMAAGVVVGISPRLLISVPLVIIFCVVGGLFDAIIEFYFYNKNK